VENNDDLKKKKMLEALTLQSELENELRRIMRDRAIDQLTDDELSEWKRISAAFDNQIDEKLREWECLQKH
jgi:hypothetical protein